MIFSLEVKMEVVWKVAEFFAFPHEGDKGAKPLCKDIRFPLFSGFFGEFQMFPLILMIFTAVVI